MTRIWRVAASCIAALLATGAQGAALDRYDAFVTVGDSLSDPGNLYRATSSDPSVATQPSDPPYPDGRFTNGPVWAEIVGDMFEQADKPVVNVAYGGARVVTNGDIVPDMPQQLDEIAGLTQTQLGTRPLGAVWLGANDLFALIDGGLQGEPLEQASRTVAQAMLDGLTRLTGEIGIGDLVVFTLPDLSLTPRYRGTPLARPAETASEAFNAALRGGLPGVPATVTLVEIDVFFDELVQHPTMFGVADATVPCVIPDAPICERPDARAFYDAVHPSAPLHAAIADTVEAELIPMPMPRPSGQPASASQ